MESLTTGPELENSQGQSRPRLPALAPPDIGYASINDQSFAAPRLVAKGQTATFTSLPKTPQPIGSPAARRAAVSASTRAVSRRMNWVLSHPPIVKFGRAAINCSAVRLASSGWPVS